MGLQSRAKRRGGSMSTIIYTIHKGGFYITSDCEDSRKINEAIYNKYIMFGFKMDYIPTLLYINRKSVLSQLKKQGYKIAPLRKPPNMSLDELASELAEFA